MLPAGNSAGALPANRMSIALLVAAAPAAAPVARAAAPTLADGRWPAEVAAPGETPGVLRDMVR
jgi:hypothetical protein